MTTLILVIAAIVYAIGALMWAAVWIAVWEADDRDNPHAARNALHTPAWPLLTLKIAARAYADLRNDAKETP